MASSGKAFDQVKAILGKLDRQVDEARRHRLGEDEEPVASAQAEPGDSQAPSGRGSASEPDPNGPNPGVLPRSSKYGRARPLNRTGDATGQWAKPAARNPSGLDETIG